MRPLRLLLVGAGRMAETHALRFGEMDGIEVSAVVDVDESKARAFAREHGIAAFHGSTEAALAAGGFEAASVVTTDAAHEAASVACLAAELPTLCEKPLSDSLESAARMVAAARVAGLPTLVNLSYRKSGALHEARRLVEAGALGEIRHVEASYRQSWLVSDLWGDWRTEDAWLWRLSTAHGSLGVLGDVGIHILDFLLAGTGRTVTGLQCRTAGFAKASGNRIGEYVLDANDSCVLNLALDNGALGVVHMSRYATGHVNELELVLHGTAGAARITTDGERDGLSLCLGEDVREGLWRDSVFEPRPDTFSRFVAALRGEAEGDEVADFAHAARLQSLLSLCFLSDASGCWTDVDVALS